MTERVVVGLEAVEVEEEEDERPLSGRGSGPLLQARDEAAPVRKTGQGVMKGLLGELLLQRRAFLDLGRQRRIGALKATPDAASQEDG